MTNCLICGQAIKGSRTKPTQFCSDGCKQEAYRIRMFIWRLLLNPVRLAYFFRMLSERFHNVSGAGASPAPEFPSAQALPADRVGAPKPFGADGGQGQEGQA